MILITGAAGKTGRAIIRALNRNNVKIRALVHRKEQAETVHLEGASDVIVGSMGDKKTLPAAVRGVRGVYHISPNVNPNEVLYGRLVINAAENEEVERFVYHSVLHPQTQAMPHHWLKLRVEEALFEARLNVTILQPEAYMQNVLVYLSDMIAKGTYTVPYPISTRLGAVDLEDVAEVAALVLTKEGHSNTTYELAGPETLSPTVLTSIISKEIGREVIPEQIQLSKWQTIARSNGLNHYQINTLTKMFRYYAQNGFRGNANILSWLLDRPPTDFATFIRRHINNKPD